MNMDRDWMDFPISDELYRNGVQYFLDFAFSNSDDEFILCPCKKCKNGVCRERKIVEVHLLTRGFLDGYSKWAVHGELSSNDLLLTSSYGGRDRLDNMHELLSDAFPMSDRENLEDTLGNGQKISNQEAEIFYKLLNDAEKDFYPGCKTFSKLSFIVRLLQIKCMGKWSDKSFTMLLDLLKESFPEGVQLPKNYYEARKTVRDLGLNYKKIDSCRNDCMIYWGVNENKNKCDTCGERRWKMSEINTSGVGTSKKRKRGKKVAAKTFWHFPLKPRLQRLFMTSRTASLMTWHAKERTKDGVMRHPADSPAWETFDSNLIAKFQLFDSNLILLSGNSEILNLQRGMSMKKRTMNDSRLGRTTNRQERSQHYVGNYLQRSESRYDEMVGEQHDGIQGKWIRLNIL